MVSPNTTLSLENMRSVSLLVFVVFVIIFSNFLFRKVPLFRDPKGVPAAAVGILAGLVVAVISYLPIKYLYGQILISETYAINLSILLGIVTAYMMVSGVNETPDIPTVALLVFLFYHQVKNFVVKGATI